jgi:inner membrane transporter RhtA
VALEFTGPLTVALLASKKKIDLLWAALAVAGIWLILPLHVAGARLDPYGILLSLAAGLFWALYIVFGKKVGTMIQGGYAASLGMVVASLVTIPFGVSALHLAALSAKVWWVALGVAVLSSAVPYTIEMFAMKKLPTTTFGILMSVEPALAALSGLAILGEQLSPVQWLAILCVIVASGGSALTSRSRSPVVTPAPGLN